MAGDLQQMRQRAAAAESLRGGRPSLKDRYAERIARNEQRRAAEAEAARQAALKQMEIEAQRKRDKQLQLYEQSNTGQRAMYAADAAANEYGYRSKLTKQEEIAQRQRDMLQNRFEDARASKAALEQELRDRRQFGFSQQEDATQFQNTLQRDAIQNQYSTERDRFQNDATLQRDANQFGYQFLRDDLGQQYTLERDVLQDRQQKDRDKLLNQFSTEQDLRQFEQQRERDMLLNDFSTQADFRQQGFNQENMYQREAAEISAKWQDQVYEARNAGFDFSEQQRKEMQEMENAFRKNVINGNLTEDVKQRAYVELQRKMSTIIPQERVRHPQETFEQSIVRDPETGQKFMTVRDPKGFERFEELPSGGGSSQQYSQQARQQQQELERITKADFERQKEYDALVDRLETEQDADENLKYPTREAAEQEAMRRFRPYEERYQRAYGLEPLEPYKRAEQQKQEEAKRQQIVQQLQQEREQFRAPGESAGGSMADSLRMRSGDVAPMSRPQPVFQPEPTPTELKQRRQQMQQAGGKLPKPPVLGAMVPLSKELVSTLDKMPGGTDLHKLRKKHASNSHVDQTVRTATDIVIMSMLTNDTSDPDLEEAIRLLADMGIKVR